MKKLFSLIALVIIVSGIVVYYNEDAPKKELTNSSFGTESSATINNNSTLVTLYQHRLTNIEVEGQGVIIKTLKDDVTGLRHQRLLLKINNQQTVLITHNIDLAPRINNPEIGQILIFKGEYVWNKKGGFIHWTHKDPKGKHPNGWLIYHNKRYQ